LDLKTAAGRVLRHLRRRGIDDTEWFGRYCALKGYTWDATDATVAWYYRAFGRWPAVAGGCFLLTEGVPVPLGPVFRHYLRTQDGKKCISFRVASGNKGKVLESVEVELRDPKGGDLNNVTSLLAHPLAMVGGWATPLPLKDVRHEGGALKGRVSVPPGFSSGMWLELVETPNGSAYTTLTGHLRPRRPGILNVQTVPAGATISVDGSHWASAPCVMYDLAPGKHVLECSSKIPKGTEGMGRSEFSGRTDIEVASRGETRVVWRLPATESAPQDGLSTRHPVHAAAAGDAITSPRATWHPQLGWMVVWSQDGNLRVTTSKDAVHWSTPATLPSPIRTAATETCEAVQVAPQTGRTVLLFRRHSDIFSCASDDLRTWSVPRPVMSDKSGQLKAKLSSLRVGLRGRFVLLGLTHYTTPTYGTDTKTIFIESHDGITWTPIEPPRTGFPCKPTETTTLSILKDGQLELSQLDRSGMELFRWVSANGSQWENKVSTKIVQRDSKGGTQVGLLRSPFTDAGLVRGHGGWLAVSPDGTLTLKKWPVLGGNWEAHFAVAPPLEAGGRDRFMVLTSDERTLLVCVTPPPAAKLEPDEALRIGYDHPPMKKVAVAPKKEAMEKASPPREETKKAATAPAEEATPAATKEAPKAKEKGNSWGAVLGILFLLVLLAAGGVVGYMVWRKRTESSS